MIMSRMGSGTIQRFCVKLFCLAASPNVDSDGNVNVRSRTGQSGQLNSDLFRSE